MKKYYNFAKEYTVAHVKAAYGLSQIEVRGLKVSDVVLMGGAILVANLVSYYTHRKVI